MSSQRKAFHKVLRDALANDSSLQECIANYYIDSKPLTEYVLSLAAPFGPLFASTNEDDLPRTTFREVGQMVAKGDPPPALLSAYSCYKIGRHAERVAKRDFLQGLGMTGGYRDDPDYIYSVLNFPVLELPKLKSSYPRQGTWVAESDDIRDLWEYHILHGKQADKRLPRHTPHVIDESQLKRTVGEDECILVRDSATKEIVLVVFRNFIGDKRILDWLSEIINEATNTRRNIRKEDQGVLVMIGLSAGSRSKPAFHWVRNLLRKYTTEEIDGFNQKQCDAFAFFWNYLNHRLPAEILDDFKSWMASSMIPAMTPEWQEMTRKGSYTINLPGQPLTFKNIDLAPPAGIMAQNYARSMHYEKQPHKWAVALTTMRTANQDDGGHFYLGAYGIRVASAANTLVVWQPGHIHGTSLQNRHPMDKNPSFVQRGISIVTSSRLTGVWQKYAQNLGLDFHKVDREARDAEGELWDGSPDEIFV